MKIRKTAKAHIAAAMVLSAALFFTGCGTNTPKETVPDVVKEELPNDESPATVDTIYIYNDVLTQYSDMVQNDFYADLRDSDTYESSFGKDIGFEIRTHKQNIYYALYDIDANGTMELVIAARENGISGPWYYDLYGYDGTDVVSIFPEMEFGYRTNFKLYENGVIGVTYSSSAAESGTDFYRIGSDGVTPELTASFASAGHLEGEQPVFIYTHNGNEISEEEYNAGIQGHKAVLTEKSDWTRIL